MTRHKHIAECLTTGSRPVDPLSRAWSWMVRAPQRPWCFQESLLPLLSLPQITMMLTSNTMDQYYLLWILHKRIHVCVFFVSSFVHSVGFIHIVHFHYSVMFPGTPQFVTKHHHLFFMRKDQVSPTRGTFYTPCLRLLVSSPCIWVGCVHWREASIWM